MNYILYRESWLLIYGKKKKTIRFILSVYISLNGQKLYKELEF